MSNEQEQVVGIEEALAKAYVVYVEFAEEQVQEALHCLDFVEWVHNSIKPQPNRMIVSWGAVEKRDQLTHLHHLIKNADMKTAEEVAENKAGHIMSFKSFVQGVIWTCEHH